MHNSITKANAVQKSRKRKIGICPLKKVFSIPKQALRCSKNFKYYNHLKFLKILSIQKTLHATETTTLHSTITINI